MGRPSGSRSLGAKMGDHFWAAAKSIFFSTSLHFYEECFERIINAELLIIQ